MKYLITILFLLGSICDAAKGGYSNIPSYSWSSMDYGSNKSKELAEVDLAQCKADMTAEESLVVSLGYIVVNKVDCSIRVATVGMNNEPLSFYANGSFGFLQKANK